MTHQQTFAKAIEHHKAGQYQQAEVLYRQILASEPNHAPALHLMGVLAHQMNKNEIALDLLSRSVAVDPSHAEAHGNLGTVKLALGRMEEAAQSFARAVELNPKNPAAHFRLGGAYLEAEKFDDAIACFKTALKLNPDFADAHANLGNALQSTKRLEEAISHYRKALALRPDFAVALNSLGNAQQTQGKTEEAIANYRRAVEIQPNYAEAHANLGVALHSKLKLDEAIACFNRALALKPNYAEGHNNLGNALRDKGRADEAIVSFQRALAARPDYAQAWANLGNALQDKHLHADATNCYRRALEIDPERTGVYNNLGNSLRQLGELDQAIECFQRVIATKPPPWIKVWGEHVEAYNNLANGTKDAGLLDEAITNYRKAIELRPNYFQVHSNLIYTLHFHPAYEPKSLLKEHLAWARVQSDPLKNRIRPHTNDRSPDRKLKVGYVSPDFFNHCQSFFTIPLLSNHDKEKFEIYCYSSVIASDAITARIKTYADHWVEALGLSDEDLSARIAADEIDILVDLTMHMANGRPLVFAPKPAAVQVAWLAYPGTTAISAMDYRLTDPYLDPPGTDESDYTEKTIRLAETFWCYDPWTEDPKPTEMPALASGRFTFGCLNNFCKINEGVLELWAKVMRAAPNSDLLILAPRGSARQRIIDSMVKKSVEASRIQFVALQPRPDYLKAFNRIDLCLDTFPSNGHTTSMDSIWMGVPVVSLTDGKIPMARGGISILSNLGLKELLAKDHEEFVRIAAGLAEDLAKLAEIRKDLRERMRKSPLMDGPRFARNMEAAYRQMWKRWCETGL